MAMVKMKLPNGEWKYDDTAPLGSPGGFGKVFRGKGSNGDVAVKRLKLEATQAAHRELKIGKDFMRVILLMSCLSSTRDKMWNRIDIFL